jgi:hypothetical protein
MYERFLASFPPDDNERPSDFPAGALEDIPGFREICGVGAGKSFGNGIVRIHSKAQIGQAARLIEEAFPECSGAIPIAKDWLGRQYVVPGGRRSTLMLIEPGSGDVFEVDCGIEELFNTEMPADPVTYLASDLFIDWTSVSDEVVPCGKCVGFKVPLFLGGAGAVENLEISDEEVYWSLIGQMRSSITGSA